MSAHIKRLLFGRDDERVYDPCNHWMVFMCENSLRWRLSWRLHYRTPWWKVNVWMMEWEYKFRMRYRDRWASAIESDITREYWQ